MRRIIAMASLLGFLASGLVVAGPAHSRDINVRSDDCAATYQSVSTRLKAKQRPKQSFMPTDKVRVSITWKNKSSSCFTGAVQTTLHVPTAWEIESPGSYCERIPSSNNLNCEFRGILQAKKSWTITLVMTVGSLDWQSRTVKITNSGGTSKPRVRVNVPAWLALQNQHQMTTDAFEKLIFDIAAQAGGKALCSGVALVLAPSGPVAAAAAVGCFIVTTLGKKYLESLLPPYYEAKAR